MNCYAVWHEKRQLRVFGNFSNARLFAINNANHGYPCQVEEYSFSSVIGILVFDTANPFK